MKKKLMIYMLVVLGIIFVVCFIWRIRNSIIYKAGQEAELDCNYQEAIEEYEKIRYYRDADNRIKILQEEEQVYTDANTLFEDGKYDEAQALYESIIDYSDSEDKVKECEEKKKDQKDNLYNQGKKAYASGDYYGAIVIFRSLGDYEESKDYIQKCYDGWRLDRADVISASAMYSIGLTDEGLKITGITNHNQDKLRKDDYISVSAGAFYSVGINKDGEAYIAGDTSWGNCLKDEERVVTNAIEADSAGYYVVLLKEDSSVISVGDTTDVDTSGWKNIVAIDAGYFWSAAVDSNGNVYVTGTNSDDVNDEIQQNSEKWSDIIDVAVGGGDKTTSSFVAGLKRDGTVVVAGCVDAGIIEAENWKGIKKLSAGDFHLVGLTESNKVITTMNLTPATDEWKSKTCCETSTYDEKIIVDIETGNATTLVVTDDGSVLSRGYDWENQIPKDGDWRIKLR